jgi:hypothetical protein
MIATVDLEAVNGGFWGLLQSWRPYNAYSNGTMGEGTNASANWSPPAPGTYSDNVQYPITDAQMRQLYEDYEPAKLNTPMEYGPMQYPTGEAPTLEPGVQAVAQYNPDGSVYESYANPQAMYDANNGGEPNYDIDYNASSLQDAQAYSDANQSGAQSFDTSGFENVDYGSQDYSDYE